jgi:sporulation protein YlmC with PRC-barrel domain
MTDIAINGKVECADGPCGQVVAVIVDRLSRRVTHVAVEDKSLAHAPYQRLVPLDQVAETTAASIRLRCTRDDIDRMAPFLHTRYVFKAQEDYSLYEGGEGPGGPGMWGTPSTVGAMATKVEEEAVPAGEVAIHYGMAVKAESQKVGQVDELVIDPDSGEVTHLLMREGHLWGKKDVTLPLSAIGAVDVDEVLLKIDKEAIRALPAVPGTRGSG